MRFYTKIVFLLFMSSCFAQDFKEKAHILESENDLDPLITAAGDKKLVLLGEASHGTHEYYAWRDKISRRLIEEHDFNFIAVEGDFASLYQLNNYVKNKEGSGKSAREVLLKLDRWPTWMWANEEVVSLAEWLRDYNDKLPQNKKVGFYGMDVYDEWRSKTEVLNFLEAHNSNLHKLVKEQYSCFSPYIGDSWQYARAVNFGRRSCADSTKNVVGLIQNNRLYFPDISENDFFYLLQNAKVVHNAEKFYRKSVASDDAGSWNSRAIHMHETVSDLLSLYGENAKGIVWAHNTHIGDANFSNMRNFDQKNIGQFSREKHGSNNVFLIGFTTYSGTVMAGSSWGTAMQKMKIPNAKSNTVESKLNKTGLEAFYLIFDEQDRSDEKMNQVLGNRAVGVVYNPRNDNRQFVPTILPMRYDAKIFFKETKALKPLKK